MSRISTIRLLSGALAVLALPANSASAGNLTIQTPKVTVHTPAPPKLNNATITQYRNGAQYPMPRKLPGRTGFDPITLNRGVVGNKTLQQWGQGVTGGGGVTGGNVIGEPSGGSMGGGIQSGGPSSGGSMGGGIQSGGPSSGGSMGGGIQSGGPSSGSSSGPGH